MLGWEEVRQHSGGGKIGFGRLAEVGIVRKECWGEGEGGRERERVGDGRV